MNKYRPAGLPTRRDLERYRKPTQTEQYRDRTHARALLRHPGWLRYVVQRAIKEVNG